MSRLPTQDIYHSLNLSLKEDPPAIHLINGLYGIGKSKCVEEVLNSIKDENIADGIITNSGPLKAGLLTYFLFDLKIYKKDDSKYSKISLNGSETETHYNKTHISELLSFIKENDEDLYHKYLSEKECKTFTGQILYELENSKSADYHELDGLLTKKGHRRLMGLTEDVASESLIVDLLSIYFPIDENSPKDLKSQMPAKPKKILIALDNYEGCLSTVNSWLFNSFFGYAYEKAFSEFISYSMTEEDDKVRVKQFFDFRFILSGRDVISDKKRYNIAREIDKSIKIHEIKKLSENETRELLKEENLKIDTDIDKLRSISFGLPGLLLLWGEFYVLDDVGDDQDIVYIKAAEHILMHLSEREKEWIRCSSYLDKFDEYGLRCFPEMNKDHQLAFRYFENCDGLALKADKKGHLTLREEIKDIITGSVASQSKKMHDEYEEIASVYQDARKIYSGLDKKEIEVLRNLAYLKVFNNNEILKYAFDRDYDLAKAFIRENPDLFKRKKYTISLKESIRKKLVAFNKRIDLQKYKEKEEFINEICEKYIKELRDKIIQNDDRIQNLNRELNDIKIKITPNKSINESLQRKYIEKENERIELKKKLNNVKYKSDIFSGLINLGLAAFVFVIAYFISDLYEGMGIEGNSDIVKTVMYGLSGIFGITSIIYFIRSLSSKIRKDEKIKTVRALQKIEKERKEHQNKMKKLRNENESMQKRIKEIEKQLESLRSENLNFRTTLTEDFT